MKFRRVQGLKLSELVLRVFTRHLDGYHTYTAGPEILLKLLCNARYRNSRLTEHTQRAVTLCCHILALLHGNGANHSAVVCNLSNFEGQAPVARIDHNLRALIHSSSPECSCALPDDLYLLKDEILAHRLCLVPLNIDPDKLEWKPGKLLLLHSWTGRLVLLDTWTLDVLTEIYLTLLQVNTPVKDTIEHDF